jgi:hypothetical protein
MHSNSIQVNELGLTEPIRQEEDEDDHEPMLDVVWPVSCALM